MTDRLVSNYLAEVEGRLEAPYRARYIIGNFMVSLVFAFAIGFVVLL